MTPVVHHPLDLDDYFPYLINRVGGALAVTFAAGPLGPYRLSIPMWRVLASLSKNGDKRLVDLAQMTSIDVSTLSRMVTRLVRLGLVTRTRSKTSEREVIVKLTARGAKVLARLIPLARQFEKAAIADIAPKDLAAVKRALRQMHRNLSARAARERGPPPE